MSQRPIELILLRQWASYLAMPVFVAGADENPAYFNQAAGALLGLTLDEMGEVPLDELLGMFRASNEDGSEMTIEQFPLAIALRKREPAHRRVRYRGLDRVWRVVDVTSFPLVGQDGLHLGAVAIFWEAKE